jgi:hypothetical protein
VVGYVFARNHELLELNLASVSLIMSCVLLTIPLFFSGIVFSTLIGRAEVNISTALAYNLIGALFGGVMEYNSMYFGFAFLYLLAMAFYLMAWAFSSEPVAEGAQPGVLPRGSLVKAMGAQIRSVFTVLGL